MPRAHLADNLTALGSLGADPGLQPRPETPAPARYLRDEPDGSLRLLTRDDRAVRMESARNPRGEADALVAAALADSTAQTVAILGAGSGALLEAVTSRGLRALVVEFAPELASAWLSSRSWTELITANRLRVLVGPDYVGAAAAARFLEGVERLPIVAHPVLLREYAAEMAGARGALDRVLRDALANADARRRFEDLALVNTVRNLPALAAGADVASLFGRFAQTPAVIVGAGPSLDDNLPAIRDLQDRALVIAADTALLPCLKAGVVPQLVVALDPGEFNGHHLAACTAATETHLATELSVDPAGIGAFAGRTFVFRVGDHAPWPWLLGAGVGRGHLSVWGSVITAALDLALRAGCPAIAFAGLDLAYTHGRPYGRGTVFEERWAWEVANGETLEAHWRFLQASRVLVDEPDVHGRTTKSADHLLAFRDWIREVVATHPTVRFANATGAGVLHAPRLTQQPLEAFLRDYPSVGRATLATTVAAVHATSIDATFGTRLAALVARAQPVDIVAGHSSGPRAAAAHVTGADLTGIRRVLEATKPVSSTAPMVANYTARQIHLPEQSALFRGLTEGTASIPAHVDAEEAAARLREAYGQLADLVERARGVPSRFEAGDLLARWHRVPARLLFDWPRGLDDAVEAFGATLADAVRLAGPSRSLPAVERVAAGERFQGEGAVDPARAAGPASEALLAPATLVWQWALAAGLIAGGETWLARTVLALLHTPPDVLPANRPATRLSVWLGGTPALPARLPFLPGLSTARAITGLIAGTVQPSSATASPVGTIRVSTSSDADEALTIVAQVEPDSLLARGHPRAHLLSRLSDREVLVGRSDGSGIAVLSESGELVRLETWPAPVRGAIPIGAHGRLAWHFPDAPHLLHRDLVTGRVDVVEVPVGVFDALEVSDGSVCLATDAGLWTWTPGRAAQPLADGPWLVSLTRHGDGVRACARPRRDDTGRWNAATELLEWRPGDRSLRVVPVAAGTAPFSVAEQAGWRAEAWLDGSLVRLVRPDGRVFWLACSGPRALAWANTTLYVSTSSGEVLRFPNLAARLAAS